MEPRPIFWILLACLLFWILVVNVVTGHSQGLSSIEVWNRQAEVEKQEELWKVTAYCACSKCCGEYADGYFASGKKCYVGGVACNWLPFGTKVKIEGMGVYTVEDRGAKSLFGDKNNHIKHVDIYFNSHSEARNFGVKWLKVEVIQ